MNRTDASTETLEFKSGQKQDSESEKMLKHVLENFTSADTARKDYEDDWRRYRNLYACKLSAKSKKWRANIFDPEPFSAVETLLPRIANTIFGAPEVFGIKPTEQNDVDTAEKTEQLLNWQADRMDLFTVGFEGVKDALIDGTGMWKVYWKQEFSPTYRIDEKLVEDVDPETGMPIVRLEQNQVKDFALSHDNICLEHIDNFALYVNPLATTVENAPDITHQIYRSRDYLKKKELEGVYHDIDLIPDSLPQTDGAEKSKDDNRTTRDTIEVPDKALKDVEILEQFCKYDIDGDGYLEECIITVANRSVVIGARENKGPVTGKIMPKPFIRLTLIPVSKSFYGMSLMKPIESIANTLNERANQIGDNLELSIHNMWKMVRWADIDEDQLVPRPGGVIEMNQLTDLEPVNVPPVFQNAYPEISRLEGKIQKALGTYDVVRGQMPDRQETATTTIALQNVGEIRFKAMTLLTERMFIRPLGKMMILNNREYMTQKRQFRILGNDFMLQQQQGFASVGKDDIVEDPDIYAVGAALEVGVNKQMQLDQMLKLLSIVSQPVFQSNPLMSVDLWAMIERFPYLMNIKTKRPVIMQGNPMLAYGEMQKDQGIADEMMKGEMQAGMPPGASAMGGGPGGPAGGPPSRTKGELAKRTNQGGASGK